MSDINRAREEILRQRKQIAILERALELACVHVNLIRNGTAYGEEKYRLNDLKHHFLGQAREELEHENNT
jgi:hypothetical protein